MIKRTILQIQYNPTDFFEAPFEYSNPQYTMSFENGMVEIDLSEVFEVVPDVLQQEITSKVRSILDGRMLSRHETYELCSISILNYREDGNISTSRTIQGVSSILKIKAYAPDILIKDATGKVIRDTKAERISEEKTLMKLFGDSANKYPLLNKIIESFKSAISDPKDELVHLYEIIDALKSNYGSKHNAISQLGLLQADWDRLFTLSNNEPLKEGRHRGSKQSLRNATEEELTEARTIAKKMIIAVLGGHR